MAISAFRSPTSRHPWRWLPAVAYLLGSLVATTAWAGNLDLHLERLAGTGGDALGTVKNGNFEHLMRELSLAFSPRSMGPAASLGPLGIDVAYEYGTSGANSSAEYWTKSVDKPTSSLTTHGVHLRKGLPYSLQVGTSLTMLEGSNLLAIGMEANLSVIDGFKNVPDLAINANVATVTGFPANSTIDMVVGGWGGTLSKSFGIAGLFGLEPWLTYSGTMTYVNTHQILVTPHAGYTIGDEYARFDKVYAISNRIGGGLRVVVTRIQLGVEFLRSVTDELNVVTFRAGGSF